MERLIAGLIMLILYLVIGTVLALVSRRLLGGRGEEDFYIAGGRLGGFLSAMTYAATTYSSFMIVGLVGFSYFTGVGALGFELAYLVATVGILVVLAPRVWSLARRRGWVSPGEMLSDIYGSRLLGVIASLLYMVALIPYASAQLKGIGEAIAGMSGGGEVAYQAGVLLGIGVMLVWSLIAGIWSVATTDALQGLWMLISATLLLLWVYSSVSGGGVDISYAASLLDKEGLTGLGGFWAPLVFLSFTLPWIFFAVTNPQVVQRLYMPRDERSLRSMVRWFSLFGLYYTILVTLIGLLARAGVEAGVFSINPESNDQVTPLLLSIANPLLASMVFTSIIAASVSTADSILLTLASSASRDLKSGGGRTIGYIAALIVAMLMTMVAMLRISYIVKLSVLSSLLLLSLAPPTLAAWTTGRRGDPRFIAAAILSGPLIVLVETLRTGSPLKAFTSTPLGLPIALLILVVSTLLTILSLRTSAPSVE